MRTNKLLKLTTERSMSWKDSPGIVAVVSGAAATAFVVTICFTVVIPTWLKSKEFEIEQLNRKIGGLQEIVKQRSEEISKLSSALRERKEEYNREVLDLNGSISELKESNKKLSLENIFSVEDVYPKGYRMVRIFEPISRISEVYKNKEIEKRNSWFSVKLDGDLVTQATYYYAKYKEKEIITHVLFHISEENASKDLIYEQLVEKFGARSAAFVKEDKREEWHFNNILKHNLEVGDGIYVIRPVLTNNSKGRS